MKIKAHIFVSGRVQGVFFRHETRKRAILLHVYGWIRNLPDGRVEALFEGEEGSVKKLIAFCRQGPPGAQVTGVNVSWADYTGAFDAFRIRG
ncbi:MAG: acylphosphatase [Candidatus Bathyarchaeota archaeon]|nr:MAG: acylphosphatase [Candidatus Bathyarchaeota archaeon]